MPGEKFCPICKSRQGPRTKNCTICGYGFTIKGVKQLDSTPGQAKEEKQDEKHGINRDERRKYLAMVKVCEDPNERLIRTKYYGKGKRVKTWESLDGKYRIRYGSHYLGVDLGDGLPYKLTYNKHGHWELPTKHRFKKLVLAIKHMKKLEEKDGKTQTEKSDSRPNVRVRTVSRGKLAKAGRG